MPREPREPSTLIVATIRERYLKTAARAYAEFLKDEADYKALLKKYPVYSDMVAKEGDRVFQLRNRVIDQAIQIIVFVGLHLEATIYDYAIQHLGETRTKEINKEKLDKKYEIIPEEVTGERLNKRAAAYNALKVTVKARNRLVHWKSIAVDSTDVDEVQKVLGRTSGMIVKLFEDAHTAMKAAVMMSFEMQRLMRKRNEQDARDAVKSGDPHDIEMESYRDRSGDGTMFPDLTRESTLVAMDLPRSLRAFALDCKRTYENSIKTK